MTFGIGEQELQWQARAREFADEWIRPAAREREWMTDPDERFPWDVIEAGSRAGFRTAAIPHEYGGPEVPLSRMSMALIVEEFAAADPGIAGYFNHAMKDVIQVLRLATDEQRETFLNEFLSDDRYLTAHASTEPNHGADRYLPPDDFRLDTTAVLDGDEWVINGRKHCIAGGNEARIVLLQATTDPTKSYAEGTTMFMVFRGTPGLEKGEVHDKAGLRMLNNSEVILENCRVPQNQVLGSVHRAVPQRRGQARDNGLLSTAMKLGIARSALDNMVAYARERVQGGKTIIEHQAVGLKLAEADALVESIRSMMYRYAWMLDNPEHFDGKFVDLTTWLSVEHAYRVATLGMHVCGCKGSWLDYQAQKHVRDAAMYFPNDGTHTIHLLRAHKRLIDAGDPVLKTVSSEAPS